MKRVSVLFLLVAIGLPMSAGLAYSADLAAGWFASASAPTVYQWVAGRQELRAMGDFLTPTGTYGPFALTGTGNASRRATVASDMYGVGSAQSLVLPMSMGLPGGESVAYISFSWATSYDAGNMYLELWRPRFSGGPELLWAQHVSGNQQGSVETAYNTVFEGNYYFKVVVVPELPAGLMFGLLTMAAAATLHWRAR